MPIFNDSTGENNMPRTIELPVNAEVLKWARTTSGLTIPQVAQALNLTTDYILEIESGRKVSKTLLARLARLYKRPLTVLFLPTPPDEMSIPTDYRTIPDQRKPIGIETANALREARRLQEVLSDLTEDPNATLPFGFLSVSIEDKPSDVGLQVRNVIGVDIAEQKRWTNSQQAFREWRGKLQTAGIYVIVGDFPREEARGFSLWNPDLIPMIIVSGNEASAAQIFTLFHELAHILLRSDAMCLKKESDTFLGTIETWCNKVAAAALVPSYDLSDLLAKWRQTTVREWALDDLYEIARVYKVSRHVIAIRLEELGFAPKGYYNRLKLTLDQDDYSIVKPSPRITKRVGEYKRDIPKLRLAEVGFAATTTILEACRSSMLSTMEAADLLKVRPSKFNRLSDLAIAQSQKYGQ